jgi:hypothetical protein
MAEVEGIVEGIHSRNEIVKVEIAAWQIRSGLSMYQTGRAVGFLSFAKT